MQCAICNEEIGKASAGYFGPEFAHNTCIVAFKQGQIDGQETEREACAKVCEEWIAVHGDYFAEKIRERSNVEVSGE
jgi:hypothetical protein